jgi:hypothetical protein
VNEYPVLVSLDPDSLCLVSRSVSIGLEPHNHLLLELNRSLMQTANGPEKFERPANRTLITSWRINVNVNIVQLAM